ncbi:DUF1707 domain-containing protein [Streptosporangiaceae bacterium NEAU-GS5]|nr:DUF1707 domain-containing protein [Streptosporangiaceae bacterium NEAU-GS5]
MAPKPEIRASDGDRDKVAAALQEHMAEGRLTSDEFNERLELVYKSRTYGELQKLTEDLPHVDLNRLPSHVSERRPSTPQHNPGQAALKGAWGAWAVASGVNWVIWLIVSLTGSGFVYPWPLWVMGPWGVLLLMGSLFGSQHKNRGDGH